MEEDGEPDREAVVPQPARTILEIGFEMKDGVAEFGVARAGNFTQLLGDGGPFAQHEARKSDLVQLLVKGKLTGKKAAVEGSKGKFQIIRIEAAGLFHRPGTGAGP